MTVHGRGEMTILEIRGLVLELACRLENDECDNIFWIAEQLYAERTGLI